MTPAEAQVLLSMASAYDNRKPDLDAAKAWASALDDLRFEDCRVALLAHYRASTEWLMPAMVRAAVRRIRAKRIAEHPAVIPPPDLATFEQQQAWQRELNRRIGDGETFDPNQFYVGADQQLRQRDLTKLRAISGPASAGPSSSGEDDA